MPTEIPEGKEVERADSDVAEEQFTYTNLHKADRVWLRKAATELRLRLRRTVRELMAGGNLLSRARRRLGPKAWRPWLSNEAQIPVRSASRLIAVHRVFNSVDVSILERFTPTALYSLSELGIPQSIREYAVQHAQDGSFVTAKWVAEVLTTARELTDRAPLKLAQKDDAAPIDVDTGMVFAHDNWRLLELLLGGDTTVHLSRATDIENGDSVVSATWIDCKGQRHTSSGATLEIVILNLTGGVRRKPCKKCGDVKSLDQYSRCKSMPDGRNKYCLVCERERVKTYARAKAASASGTK